MTPETWFWVLAVVATLCVGASKGGLPMIGLLSVPIMSVVMSPVVAAGLLLPLYVVSDMYGLWLYRKSYDLRNLYILVPATTIGILIGWATASFTSDNLVKGIVGMIGISYMIDALLKSRRNYPPRKADIPRGMFWGTIAGFTSFVSHSGGPPYQMYVLPQRLEKMVYAGTSTILFTIINALKLPPYWMLGQINVTSLKTGIMLAPVALFGAFAGYHLTRIIPEKLFFRLVEVALFILSVRLLYEAFFGPH